METAAGKRTDWSSVMLFAVFTVGSIILAVTLAYGELKSSPETRAFFMQGYGRDLLWSLLPLRVSLVLLPAMMALAVLVSAFLLLAMSITLSYDVEALAAWISSLGMEECPARGTLVRLAVAGPFSQAVLVYMCDGFPMRGCGAPLLLSTTVGLVGVFTYTCGTHFRELHSEDSDRG